MKVISLLQPWASLVVAGHKKIETRSWNTKYRGPLLIHASAKKFIPNPVIYGCDLINEFSKTELSYKNLHYGAIIGQVNLIDTFQFNNDPEDQLSNYKGEQNPWIPKRQNGNNFESIDEEKEWIDNMDKELIFGDYSPGRWGWLLSDPVLFNEPIPAKGKLGLWEYDLDISVFQQY